MKETFYKTRTLVPSVAQQRISVVEGSMRMQMKSDILKDKSESERNEIWHIVVYRCILSFHTLVFPAHNHAVFFANGLQSILQAQTSF
jgi:hypothetical protein